MRSSRRRSGETSNSAIVRRMVNLPRSIFDGVSRVMGQGIDLMRIGGRRHDHVLPTTSNFPLYHHPSSLPLQDPFSFPRQDFSFPRQDDSSVIQEEWAFLTNFEQQYGTAHPFFYACRFADALKMAQDEHKFVFVYIHSPDHPFTPSFCRETLCSDIVIQFLDVNFICWAALANRAEGSQLATTLRASTFPFCALVAPASGDSIAVLQQMEGPVSPAEMVEILQRTLEEQGLAFGNGRKKEEEKRSADRRLREEQDAAYFAALRIDQEREKHKKTHQEEKGPDRPPANKIEQEKLKQDNAKKQHGKLKEATNIGGTVQKDNARGDKKPAQVTQILVRFPNGERRDQSFLCTEKIQAIFRYIDSLGLPGVGNYRLISNFPRKVYGVDQMGLTLKDAGLHPKASLFLELL